jgi:hypothetical protein
MANKTVFRLEWSLSDILKNYPELTISQAQQILDDLYNGKDTLIQEGWYVIADMINNIKNVSATS